MRSLSTAPFLARGAIVALAVAILVGGLTVFRADALPPFGGTLDLGTEAGLTVYGDDAGDESGWSIASGDIDGDTTADLIIGAPKASTSSRGEAYVIYGGTPGVELPAVGGAIDLDSTSAGFTVVGAGISDMLGFSIAAGDVNGDGTDDLVVGAPFAGSGEAYIILGGTPGVELPAAGGSLDLGVTNADLTLFGDGNAGISVATGDINGDTIADIIVGAYTAAPGGRNAAGKTYIVYGYASLGTEDGAGHGSCSDGLDNGGAFDGTDLGDSECFVNLIAGADLAVYGDDRADRSGHSVRAGDIDGDGTDDLIIGANEADGSGSGTSCGTGEVGDQCDAGETYVIYGGTPGVDLPAVGGVIDLNSTSADLTVYGADNRDDSGISVGAGDIDGDTTDDLIIGARWADGSGNGTCGTGQVGDSCLAGETYVIYGGTPGVDLPAVGGSIDLDSTSADLTVYGRHADMSGWAVASGDIDGDTTQDLIIGAIWANVPGAGNAGETYVIYGGPGLPSIIDIDSTSAGLTAYGVNGDDHSGISVGAGDINGDTIDDLLIGAYHADGSGTGTACGGQTGDRCFAGDSYVVYGGPLDPTPTPTPTPPKLTKPGDTDGDGCADEHENGPDETLGGQRDWQNPNDFYDVAGSPLPPQNGAPDGVIDLPNDILGVIQHHPAGTLGYDAQFDRGTWTGPNSWNQTQGPDGVIDLPNDILGVILQFNHRCV